MMHKTYFVLLGQDPHATFGSWTPHQCIEWHTHPLGATDSIVTMRFRDGDGAAQLDGLEAAGQVLVFPSLAFAATLDAKNAAIAKHPELKRLGVLGSHRTYDAALVLHAALGWNPLHPERR